jgi:hypothetical protein
MQIDVIDNLADLNRLKSDWDTVYEADPESQFFLSWTWTANWFDGLNCQWIALAARPNLRASRYVAFFPLVLRTQRNESDGFYNDIGVGGGHFAGYTGLICTPNFQSDAIPAFANHMQQLNWTNLHLENICASPERLRLFFGSFPPSDFVTEKIERVDEGDGLDNNIYPYVKLPGDWETYLYKHVSPKTRKKARRFLRQVEDSGEFRITHASAATIERDIDTLLRFWEIKWGPKKGQRVTHIMVSNYRKMMMRCFESGSLFLPVIREGETPIAAQALLTDTKKRSALCLIAGRDLTVTEASPGFGLDVHCIRWAIQNGFATYDFLRGNEPYKYVFGCEDRRIEWLRVRTRTGRNLRGKLEKRSLPVVLEQVKNLREVGERVEAERGCRQILDVDPGHAPALDLLRQLQTHNIADSRADFAAALAFHQRGQLTDAERLYCSILAIEPKHFDASHLLGVIFLQRGQFEMAERQLGLAIQINPRVAAAYNNRGNALRRLKRPEEALASYDTAIALKPDYPEAYNNRGNTLKQLKRLTEALASYDRAIALKPDYPDASANRRSVLQDLMTSSAAGGVSSS